MRKHAIVSLAIDLLTTRVGHQFQWAIFRFFCSVQMQACSLAQARKKLLLLRYQIILRNFLLIVLENKRILPNGYEIFLEMKSCHSLNSRAVLGKIPFL